ncbi:restriction endonuclease [Staphylococcus sp. LCT-H4]|uniref:restriction endonuclease n=1 Tax=Staphylococcus sp. LCT-H4 TaxID=1914308 RepID=UPI0008F4AC59|nr:restriction endonuclease [Staphylococcus sp. LCT-H4]OIJ29102.1 restriction endonuclease [Staphylococcus sp. LCT-H4]
MNINSISVFNILIIVGILVIAYKSLPVIIKLLKKKKIQNLYRKARVHDVDKMDGIEFEYYLEALFSKLKYKPTVTKASHDYGADLILKNENKKIVVQAKRSNGKIGIKAVQEIYAAQRYHNADEAWLVTNSFYTKSAIELGNACSIIMKDRNTLSKWIIKINPDFSNSKSCPKCRNELVVRTGKNGQFLGCSNYPNCKYTKNI